MNNNQNIEIGSALLDQVFDNFKTLAKTKIESVAKRSENDTAVIQFFLPLKPKTDLTFDRVITCLCKASQPCLGVFAESLLQWWQDARGISLMVEDGKLLKKDAGPRIHKRISSSGTVGGHKRSASTSSSDAKVQAMLELQRGQQQASAADYIYGRLLIEILEDAQTGLPEKLSQQIENLTFQTIINSETMYTLLKASTRAELVDLFADLVGVMSKTRFDSSTKYFLDQLKKYGNSSKTREIVGVINLTRGMKKLRLHNYPMTELEKSASFVLELCQFLAGLKSQPDLKHALFELYVALIIPWSAQFKSEVNLPKIRNSVETVYEKSVKSKRVSLSMITAILCCSQKPFFLDKWPSFLAQCLSSIKDTRESEEAILSIHRCLWVYMYRVGGQSNNETQSRLKSIITKCFPKSPSYGIYPRGTPVDVFVDIFLFISEIRIDFIFNEAIFPLLGLSQNNKVKISQLCPLRMSIALKAARVIADMKIEGEKPKFCAGSLTAKRNYACIFINEPLERVQCLELGFGTFFDSLRQLLATVLTFVNTTVNKLEFEQSDNAEDYVILYRTLLNSIPRLFPTGVPEETVVQTICTASVHENIALRGEAAFALQRIIEFMPGIAYLVIHCLADFLLEKDLEKTGLEEAMNVLLKLNETWVECLQKQTESNTAKSRVIPNAKHKRSDSAHGLLSSEKPAKNSSQLQSDCIRSVHSVERLSLLCLCSNNCSIRLLAVELLRSTKKLTLVANKICIQTSEGKADIDPYKDVDKLLITVIEENAWSIAEEYSSYNTQGHRGNFDKQFFEILKSPQIDWHICLGALVKKVMVIKSFLFLDSCWNIVCMRFIDSFTHINEVKKLTDVPGGDYIQSYVRQNDGLFDRKIWGFQKEEKLTEHAISQWINFLTFLCALAPPNTQKRAVSDQRNKLAERSNSKTGKHLIVSTKDLLCSVIPFIRHEDTDFVKKIIHCLGSINSQAYEVLATELNPYQTLTSTLKSDKKRRLIRVRIACILEFSSSCFSDVMLLSKPEMKKYTLSYIKETLDYLNKTDLSASEDGKLDMHFANHIHFMMVHCAKLKYINEYFDPYLRGQLYVYFSSTFGNKEEKASLIKRTPSETPTGGTHERTNSFGKTTKRGKRSSSNQHTINAVDAQKRKVKMSSVRAMVSMFHGPLFNTSLLEHNSFLFQDIKCLLTISKLRDLGRDAVKLLLRYNQKDSQMLDIILYLAYTSIPVVAEGYFLALASSLDSQEINIERGDIFRIICLVLYKTGDPNQHIRKTAITLMTTLIKKHLDGSKATPHQLSLTSVLSATYTFSQQELSADLASSHVEHARKMINEMMTRIPTVPHSGQEMMLQCLVPWLYKIDLQNEAVDATYILCCLFDLTVTLEESHPKAIENLWKGLAKVRDNLLVTFDYLIFLGTKLGCTSAVILPHAQKIAIYLGRVNTKKIITIICDILQLNVSQRLSKNNFQSTEMYLRFFMENIPKDIEFVVMSKAVFTLCVCVELITEAPVGLVTDRLSVLLQPLFIHLDHKSTLVRRNLKTFLANLIHLFTTHVEITNPIYDHSQSFIEEMIQNDDPLWESVDCLHKDYKTGLENLQRIVTTVVRVLCITVKNIQEIWALTSHNWALDCEKIHDANKSLQIFRALKAKPSAKIFSELISRLSNSVVDTDVTVHTYVIELIKTLKTCTTISSVNLLQQYPQVLWVAIVILDSDEEQEWTSGVELLNAIIEKISFQDAGNLLKELDWNNYLGLNAIVIKGLTSSINMDITIDTLERFIPQLNQTNDPILDPHQNGLLFNIIALLPYLVSSFETPTARHFKIARTVAEKCKNSNFDNLSRVFALYCETESAYVKGEEEWVKNTCFHISKDFFPDYEKPVISLLLMLLESPYSYVHRKALFRVLNSLIMAIDVTNSSYIIDDKDPHNLISVLMRAVNSKIVWEDALPSLAITMAKWKPQSASIDKGKTTKAKVLPTKKISAWRMAYASQERTRKRLKAIVLSFNEDSDPIYLARAVAFKPSIDSGDYSTYGNHRITLNEVDKRKSWRDDYLEGNTATGMESITEGVPKFISHGFDLNATVSNESSTTVESNLDSSSINSDITINSGLHLTMSAGIFRTASQGKTGAAREKNAGSASPKLDTIAGSTANIIEGTSNKSTSSSNTTITTTTTTTTEPRSKIIKKRSDISVAINRSEDKELISQINQVARSRSTDINMTPDTNPITMDYFKGAVSSPPPRPPPMKPKPLPKPNIPPKPAQKPIRRPNLNSRNQAMNASHIRRKSDNPPEVNDNFGVSPGMIKQRSATMVNPNTLAPKPVPPVRTRSANALTQSQPSTKVVPRNDGGNEATRMRKQRSTESTISAISNTELSDFFGEFDDFLQHEN